MHCPHCQHENREGAHFCEACATPLGCVCARCGSTLRASARFCDRCGAPVEAARAAADRNLRAYTPKHLAEKILTSRAALEGERKQVTVLFADVKGSLDLAEQVDPEQWHGILDRFFQILAEGVHRFEGTVNQYTGDGIMALFGAPIAHEDHAQRASFAALYLRDQLRAYADELRLARGLNFAVRMGLNSGEVVVGRIGDDLRMDYTAQGHTVGLAARMEQIAEPGTVYLTEHTARLVSGFVRLHDLGAATIKGAGAPIRVHRLEGTGTMRSRLDVSRMRGFSRFVGREAEMATLEAALARALAGQGQVVGVVAEPGVGKSRLCHEFVERCRGRDIAVAAGQGVAHGKLIPFLPIFELFRSIYGITEHDDDRVARTKIAGRVLLLDESFRDALPVIFDFLGVADPAGPPLRLDPDARQHQIAVFAKRVVRARSQVEPAVILLEDLHWLDGGSEAMLAAFIEATVGTRTLMLVNFRPEYRAPWMQKPSYQQLPLLPLGAAAIDALLADLLGGDPALASLTERIRTRTGGNPFFIEECVQALAEGGTLAGAKGAYRLVRPGAEVVLPDTVQALLAARIDRLPEREKLLLQAAAVIGTDVAEPVLRAVADLPEGDLAAALHALQAAELLYEAEIYPETVYAFKHPLTQEVAYRSQLGERRARVHAAVARAIEAAYPDKLGERSALLAHHCEGAGAALTAAEWHRRAAEWVGNRDRRAMFRHWLQVRRLLTTDAPESPAASLALGLEARIQILSCMLFLGPMGEDPSALLAEGTELAERLDKPAARIQLLITSGSALMSTGTSLAAAMAELTEALRLADASAVPLSRFLVRPPLAMMLMTAGRLHDAVRIFAEAEALCGGDPEVGTDVYGFSPYGLMSVVLGLSFAIMGRRKEAEEAFARAMAIGDARQDVEVSTPARIFGTILCDFAGDGARALQLATEAMELAEKGGSSLLRLGALSALAQAYLTSGRWAEAIEATTAALAMMREVRAGMQTEAWRLGLLAEAHLGAGALEEAGATAEEAVTIARARGTRVYEPRALIVWARALLRRADPSDGGKAAELLAQATAAVEEMGACMHLPAIHEARAELAGVVGDSAARRHELEEARRFLEEMGAAARAARIARELQT